MPVIPLKVVPPTPLPSSTSRDDCSPEDITIFLNQAATLLQQFDEIGTVAETTPPEDLLQVVQEMDALAKSTDSLLQIPCTLKARAALGEYFIHMIQGYMRTYAEALEITSQSDRSARDEFLAATDKLALFNRLSSELSGLAGSKNRGD